MTHNVLLVDDEKPILEGLRRALYAEPYVLFTAQSASRALEIMQTVTIDVVVSDEKMPGMSGSDFLTSIRKVYPETIRIMLTGQADVTSAMNAIYDGWVYQYLHKPISAATLASTIYNGLLLRSLNREGEAPLVMTSKQREELLFSMSQPQVRTLVEDDSLDLKRTVIEQDSIADITEVIQEIGEALDRAEDKGTIKEVIRDMRDALDKIESTQMYQA